MSLRSFRTTQKLCLDFQCTFIWWNILRMKTVNLSWMFLVSMWISSSGMTMVYIWICSWLKAKESMVARVIIRQNFKKHVPMHTRLPMILTVVLYVGESKWNVAKRLSELEIIHPGFEDMFNEFKLNMIELNTNWN